MTRLYLFAEGQTEQTFATNILKPHLAKMGVYLFGPILIASGKSKHGKTPRGGGRQYMPMRKDIQIKLAEDKSPDMFVTTMIDLYALPAKFPGWEEAEKLRHVPPKRVEAFERAFADDIGDVRFIPYIQLHEYEAYLFSDPTWFRYYYPGHEKEIAQLKAISEKALPEEINEGEHTSPSKRIIKEFPTYERAKPVEGSGVAELIGLDIIRSKCPHFSAWLSKLEQLGTGVSRP